MVADTTTTERIAHMAKTLSSKISDPRPRINVTMTSDDDKTIAQITKGYVNIQRGPKTAILRMPVGELSGLMDVMAEATKVLEANGYDTKAGSDEPIAPPMTRGRHTDEAVSVPDDASSIDNPFAHQQ
jgi:hypothetical protein